MNLQTNKIFKNYSRAYIYDVYIYKNGQHIYGLHVFGNEKKKHKINGSDLQYR